MLSAHRQSASLPSLLEAVDAIEGTLRRHSRQAERERRLPEPVVQALRDSGLYRMFRPTPLGGFGLDPVAEFTVAESIARIDGAAAWNVQVCNAGELFGGWFGREATQEVFGEASAIVAGAFNPKRRAEVVDGGYVLSGTAPFTSNCHGADWIMGLAEACDDGIARLDAAGNPIELLTLVPARECRIVDNWDTMGLAGTGSHDVAIDAVFVPEQRAVPFAPAVEPSECYDNANSRMAIWITAASHAAVALGVARAAVEDLIELGTKVPSYSRDTISSRSRVQSRLAQAQGQLESARLYFYATYDDAWSAAARDNALTMQQKARCQLATTHAVMASASAVDLVHSCVGTTGIRQTHSFEKCFRDVHVITQHAYVSEARLESVGQIMFGQAPDWPFFAF